MSDRPSVALEEFSGLLHVEINRALKTAGLISMLLGIVGGMTIVSLTAFHVARNLFIPMVFSFTAASYSTVLYVLAKRNLLRRWLLSVLILPFVAMPTLFFLTTHFFMPAGAATFMTGPISYLYFHLIIMTGFIFDFRLSTISGVLSALGYLLVFWLGRDEIARVTAPDPTLYQDLTSISIYSVKSIMMLFGGLLVGALAVNFKRLIVKILVESREKARISRLFGQYVSDEVREKIVGEKASVVGEKKSVAVLFSDIRSFSTFSEGRDPGEIVNRLNEYFEKMVQGIASNGGVVDKFVGDAIMGVFGGVIDLDNPCDRAVQAALAMRQNLKTLNAGFPDGKTDRFENGVGIHYGEVLQGSIGSSGRKEFTVIGDNVNLASRVEGLTKNYPFSIIVTRAVVDKLTEALRARCEPIEKVRVKGKSEEVEIFGVRET
jgi:adenylate cyclase